MLAIEAYKSLLLKVNRNDTNSDIDISRGEFVLLFNEQKDIWLSTKIKEYESKSEVEELQDVAVKHLEIIKDIDAIEYSTFFLPKNFFSKISSYSFCSNKDCSGVIIRHFPMKPKNENMLLENANTEPSFDFEETVVDLSNNKLYVYKKDFEIDKTFLNYYRQIGKIDIAGYRKVDGSLSTDIHPDISDPLVEEIVNRCAREIIARYENPDGYQLAQARITQE